MSEVLNVPLPGVEPGGYPVVVGEGSSERLAELLAAHCPAHRYALITDSRVRELHAERLARRLRDAGARVDVFAFPDGERQKTRDTWARLSDQMLESGMGRDSAVVAVGGGVVGDLAGFVAATFMRGVPCVQVPTTLLAMVDASVGGKTGVDTPAGKNLIGAFHPPRVVVADVALLGTLPAREFRAGLAEAVKHGAIADVDHFEWLRARSEKIAAGAADLMEQVVVRSVEIKAASVASDEREAGFRKTLNFGHTIGHAVEAASGFGVLHGEAVGIGMVAEARIGEIIGVTETGSAARLRDLLQAVGLPTALPAGMEPRAVVGLTRTDKKSRGGAVEFALIERIGRAHPGPDGQWGTPVADSVVEEALRDG